MPDAVLPVKNPLVPPLTIRRAQRAYPKDSESQSSHEYAVVDKFCSGNDNSIAVAPVRIKRSKRVQPKESQSSHEYTIMKDGIGSLDINCNDILSKVR